MSLAPLIICPDCKGKIRSDRLDNHARRKCPSRPMQRSVTLTSMSSSILIICPGCKGRIRADRLENHARRKCPSRPMQSSRTRKLVLAAIPKNDNEGLHEFCGVLIPPTCRKLRYCSIKIDDKEGVLVVSNSGIHIHRFSNLSKAQKWYDALLSHWQLPHKLLETYYPPTQLEQQQPRALDSSRFKLTSNQRMFLKRHGVSLSLVFDATGLSEDQRLSLMKQLDKKFYYGGAPCSAAGHTLRSKAGHCIECDTAKIAFQLRSSESGYVYIAYSNREQCAKIGTTSATPKERVAFLAHSGYANCTDWRLIESVHISSKAGAKEFKIHSLLEPFQKRVVYKKQDGLEVECREVFFCDLAEALSAYHKVLSNT